MLFFNKVYNLVTNVSRYIDKIYLKETKKESCYEPL